MLYTDAYGSPNQHPGRAQHADAAGGYPVAAPRAGDALVEREMVDRLGVSRTGVRAALQSLEAEGLVVRGHRGVFSVAVVSREEARQIYEVRAAMEPAVARLFIAHASDEQVAALGEAAKPAGRHSIKPAPAEWAPTRWRW